jgi:predicted dehydrogenase
MKQFRIAIVGCGNMANTWIKYAKNRIDAHIVALVDINPENAHRLAQQYLLECNVYTDLKDAINETNPNLVFDITVPEAHKAIVTTALELGCDVLGEKPMASGMEDANHMLKVVQQTKRSYAVMQNRRYLKNIRDLRTMLENNAIGRIGYVGADFFLGPHFGGFRDIMNSPLLLDMAIHTFDQARFIADADPVSVYCHEYNPPGSWYRGNASAICIFEFSNSSVFCYRGSWCAEGFNTSWEADWRIIGSKGTVLWDGINAPCGEVVEEHDTSFMSKIKRIRNEGNWVGNEGHTGCLDEMFNALFEGRKAETDCSDNIKSMAMVFGAIESAKTGKKIMLNK